MARQKIVVGGPDGPQLVDFTPEEETARDAEEAAWLAQFTDPEYLCDQIDVMRDAKIAAGFVFEGVHYQAQPKDLDNITGAGALATASVMGLVPWPDDFVWIATDNSKTPMSAAKMVAFGAYAAHFKSALILKANSIKSQIRAGDITDITDPAIWD